MLSRRSVRVKVMQIMYATSKDDTLTLRDGRKMYWDFIDRSYDLLLFNLFVISNITKISSEDESRRKAKHLPDAYDKAFSDKLFSNDLIKSIHDDAILQKEFVKKNFPASTDTDHLRKIYNAFSKSGAYKDYVMKESDTSDHVEILLELYRHCRQNEIFKEVMADAFVNWSDDKSMVIGAVKKIIKALPLEDTSEVKKYYPDEETVKEYGEQLLEKVQDGNDYLLSLINPLLENWDSDRLASIDMILLKMAACEMLNFETIPCKVTINEYVDIAKNYSTDKSTEFVNGVLDKLMKKLIDDNKIDKKGRGLLN